MGGSSMDLKQAKVFGMIMDVVLPILYLIMIAAIHRHIRPIAGPGYINGIGYLFSAVSLLTPLAAFKLYQKGGRTIQFRLVVYAAYTLPATLGLVYFLIGGQLRYTIGFMVLTAGYFLLLDHLVFGSSHPEQEEEPEHGDQ